MLRVSFKKYQCRMSLSLKPIFHCKLGSCWVTNTNEMSTNNMKSTLPTPAPTPGDPTVLYFTDSREGVRVWGNALGVTQICAFLDTNILVYPMQICGKREDPTRRVLRCSGI